MAGRPGIDGRPPAEMSSVQALMELTLPRFAMPEGPRHVHPPWPVISEPPASPAPSQIEQHRDGTCAVQWTRHSRHQCTLT